MSGSADICATTGAQKNEIDEARDAIMSDNGAENANKYIPIIYGRTD